MITRRRKKRKKRKKRNAHHAARRRTVSRGERLSPCGTAFARTTISSRARNSALPRSFAVYERNPRTVSGRSMRRDQPNIRSMRERRRRRHVTIRNSDFPPRRRRKLRATPSADIPMHALRFALRPACVHRADAARNRRERRNSPMRPMHFQKIVLRLIVDDVSRAVVE